MNKRIISLCTILFILIICTTVSAEDLSAADETTDFNNTTTYTSLTSTTEINLENTDISNTINTDNLILSESTTTSANLNNEQSVQNAGENENKIVKRTNTLNSISVTSDTVKSATGINISGVVTTAINKTNGKYALSEIEGFIASGAKISLYNNETGKLLATTTSADDGTYHFDNVNSGYYHVKFEYGTYKNESVRIRVTNESYDLDYIFVPDITIIAFSGDSSGSGQSDKVSYLKEISDRVLFLESYELNNSYDRSGQWMLSYSNFILVDMFSIGNGFGIDTDLIANSPASHKHMIAYTFGIFDYGIIGGTLSNWGFLGGNPQSLENTYIGSYWQSLSSNSSTIKVNLNNMFDYIRYLLGETTVDPTKDGRTPLVLSNSWGIYYPGFEGDVKTPNATLINQWIINNPGYNADGAGSLNWMIEDYGKWNLENNDPVKILRNFEDWYTKTKNITGSFIVIANYYEGGTVVDALIKEYEKQGRAVFCLYKATAEDPDMTYLLELAGNKSVIKRGVVAVSYMYWWTTGYAQRGSDYTINAYKNLNVSLINALKDISQVSFESEFGPQNEWTAAVTMPQFEGVYGALPVSYVNNNKETVLIPEGIAKHVQLTNGWARLKELNNTDKKVTIVLYGYPPGKANIGASYLDVFQSVHDLLEKMYDAGYDIGMNKSEIPTTEEIDAIVSDFGNKGQWAEGLLDLYVVQHYDSLVEHGQLVSDKQYYEWYNELPEDLQQQMVDSWGELLGNGSMIYREKVEVNYEGFNNWLEGLSESNRDEFMHFWNMSKNGIIISESSESMVLNKTNFYKWLFDLPLNLQTAFNESAGFQILSETKFKNDGYLLIPGQYFGNIFLSVQPVRGWDSQIDFHNSYLAPPQQYIAYYRYLSRIFRNDAIIHMGTHGTLEWLPGRSLGLQSSDWPFQLIETPIIYPYIVSNPGEGMVAKERSFAQILTHMTPVLSTTELYGEYLELNDAINRYDASKTSGVEDNIAYYRDLIINLTESVGYDQPDYVIVNGYIDDYYIALNNGDEEEIANATRDLYHIAEIVGFEAPAPDLMNQWLEDLTNYLNDPNRFEEWLARIHEDLEAMSADKINSGMHTLGKIWVDSELIMGTTTIASSRTNVLDDIMHMMYPEIKGSYYDNIKERDFEIYKKAISDTLTIMITNLVNNQTIEELAHSYGIYNTSYPVYQDLLEIQDMIQKIQDNKEWLYIFTALDGGYVEPGLAADPAYGDVIPTGRSMYVSDTTKIPSKSAWQSAVNSVDQLLIKYMVNLGEASFPEMVGEIIWGTEALRTEGISLAQFLYLLGVKPTWDRTGKVNGTEIIPLDELSITINGTIYFRPRIDAFATIVTNNPNWIELLTDAVEKVNALNESTMDNFVKKHYAELPSLERLFGLPGAILEGTGVADMLKAESSTLNGSTDIADKLASVYETRIGHSWNLDDEGNILVQNDSETFSYILDHVDLIIQNLDSTWRYLDSDDYLDWFGGLLNAANVHGTTPNTILLDIRDKNNIITNTLGEEAKREVRTTLLNPQWLNEMTSSVGGWNQMSMNFENIMGTMLTTQKYKETQSGKAYLDTSGKNNAGVFGQGVLRELAEMVTYSEYMNIDAQHKTYAFQSMAGWLLLSDMAGYWENNDLELKKALLQKYVDNANRYGVACCHHTCGNINLHEWIIKTGASLGVTGLPEYSQQYASVTKNPSAIYDPNSQVDTANPDADIGSGGTGESGTVDVSEGISGYLNQGATSEANAGSRAGAGAAGVAGASQSMTSSSNAMAMAGVNTGDGTGQGGNGEGNGSGDGIGDGNGTSTDPNAGEGNSTGEGTENGDTNGTGQGTGDNSNIPSDSDSTSDNQDDDTNSTITTEDTSAGENPTPGESSAAGDSASASASSAGGGSSASSSATASMYEVIEKTLGRPPASQSEISIGYLMFVVALLLIFFVGFRRPDVRER